MDTDLGKLDLLGLMPCPLRLPFQELSTRKAKEIEQKTGRHLRVASYGMMYKKPVKDLFSRTDIDQWPSAVFFFGLGPFFTDRFKKLFIEPGYFEAIVTQRKNPTMERLGMYDPKGIYDVLGFSPYFLMVDKTRRPDMPTPKGWVDMTGEAFRGTIGFKGREPDPFCDMTLLSVQKFGGDEALENLGRNVAYRVSCAEMCRIAGSRRPEAPQISVLPWTFAKSRKESELVKFICPEEGAACLPLMCLTKKTADDTVKEYVRSLCTTEEAFSYHKAGFMTSSSDFDMGFNNYYWFGWDLLHGNYAQNLQKCNMLAHKHYSGPVTETKKENIPCSC